MKKLVATILIALMAMSCLLAFVGCNGDSDKIPNGDITVGAVSKKTYVNAQSAVKGFLQEEISGMEFTAEFVGYTKTSDLSQNEIDRLTIDDMYKNNIVSVEMGQVKYSAQYATSKLTRDVYVITYNTGECRFISPEVKVGETLTASYLNSLLSEINYLNSTFTIDSNDLEDSGKETTVSRIVGKFTDNTYYYSFNSSYDGEELSSNSFSYFENDVIYLYGNEVEDEEYNFDYFTDLDESDFLNGLKDGICCMFDDYLLFGDMDHTCFVKTSTGFHVREKLMEENDEIPFTSYIVSVEDKVITEVIANVDDEGMGSVVVRCKIFDIGTTKIDLPKEFLDKIQYVKQ
ncbi:MAG: hypothetical protein K2O35_01280, partial [Clostridia bacterium]|nr:hypothetical protein [Clostridia bacterium]